MQRSELAKNSCVRKGNRYQKHLHLEKTNFPILYVSENAMQKTHRKKKKISSAAHRVKYLVYVIPWRAKLGKL